jgi:hypothetical protein
MRTGALHRPPYHSGCAAPDGDGQLFLRIAERASDRRAFFRLRSKAMTAWPEGSATFAGPAGFAGLARLIHTGQKDARVSNIGILPSGRVNQ